MRFRILLAATAFFVVTAQAAPAEDFWQKKPFDQWSKKEAEHLLGDSAWSKQTVLTIVSGGVGSGRPANPTGMASSTETAMSSAPEHSAAANITYQVQLRSAATLRRAIVRLGQINGQYDKMSAADKASFDRNASQYLDATFPDSIAVYVTYDSSVRTYLPDLQRYWRAQDATLLKNSVFLNVGGEKLPLVGYALAQGQAFQFAFPRPKNLPPDAVLGVEFTHPQIGTSESHVVVEFKLKQMVVNGTPDF